MNLSSGEKKLFVFSGLLLVIPLGVALFWRANATPAPAIPAYPKAPTPNGYDLYVAAAAAMVPAKPPVDALLDKGEFDAKTRAQRYSLGRKTAWLEQNKRAFALFERAQQTPSLAPPNRSLFGTVPTQKQLRRLARDKLVERNAYWLRGDDARVLHSGLQLVRMGHDIRRGGNVLANLNGVAIGAQGRHALQDAVERVDAGQAKSAARELEKLLASRWNGAQVLTEEKYCAQNNWLELFKMGNWRLLLPVFADKPTWKEYAGAQTIAKTRLLNETETLFERYIARARLPYTKSSNKTIVAGNPYLNRGQILLPRQRFNDARDLAGDRVLMLRLALRAYRLENGSYPSSLHALTPRYLKAVPADPFGGGEPVRYKRSAQSYRLWSIGPDEIDNGGTPIPWKTVQPAPRPYERAQWPLIYAESKGDYVAGRNW